MVTFSKLVNNQEGIFAFLGAIVTVRNSSATGNTDAGFAVQNGGEMNVDRSVSSNNDRGVLECTLNLRQVVKLGLSDKAFAQIRLAADNPKPNAVASDYRLLRESDQCEREPQAGLHIRRGTLLPS